MVKIGTLAQDLNVSVRTLHHYDEIGLLKPKVDQETKHRYYDLEDVERLKLIILFKYVGFSLQDIAEILKRSQEDQLKILKNQKAYLLSQRNELSDLISYIDSLSGDKVMDVTYLPKPSDARRVSLPSVKEQSVLERRLVEAHKSVAQLTHLNPKDDAVQEALIHLYNITNAQQGGFLSVEMFLRIYNESVVYDQLLLEIDKEVPGYPLFFMEALNTFRGN